MASSRKHSSPWLGRLLSTSFALAPALAIADSQLHPYEQWVCEPGADGSWQCSEQPTTPGVYPKPTLMAPVKTDRHAKQARKAKGDKARGRAATVSVANRDWDWKDKSQLQDPEQCRSGCEGGFEAPQADWKDADKEPADAPMRSESNKSVTEGDIITLEGDITITQGNRRLKADDATFNRARNEIALSGNIEIREPNLLIRGDQAFFDAESGLGEIDGARFVQHDKHLHGTAQKAERIGEQVVEMDQASFSQCEPEDEDWIVKTSTLTLDNATGTGTAKHARLYVGSVPVLYSPYLSFPIDDRRKSGFLWPSVGSGNNGFDLTAPYYLNLAPNYDATVAPRYIADRGNMAEVEFRHLSRFDQWVLAGSHLSDDDVTGEDRWLGSIEQEGRIGSRWRTGIDYTKVSDDEFFDDFTLNSIDARRQTHLDQRANITYSSPDWVSTLRVVDYQTIDDNDEPYKRLPQLSLAKRGLPDNFAANFIFEGEYTDFDHDDFTEVIGERLYGEAGVSYPMRWVAGYIVPTVKVRHVSYDLDNTLPGDDDSPSTTVPLGTIDMGLVFERQSGSFTQTLEPRLYYFWSDFEDQADQPDFDTGRLTFTYDQLYRDTRFSGHDRLDDANQITIGLTSRLLNNKTGDEVLSASIGQIIYFEDRRVFLDSTAPEIRDQDDLSSSNIAGGLHYQPSDNFWINSNLLWDSRQGNLNEGGFGLHYLADNNAIYNLGSRYRRAGATNSGSTTRDLKNIDGSVVYPFSNHWKVFAKYQYDLEEHRSQEDLLGIEYNSCCWVGRLVYQRAITDDDGNSITRDNIVLLEFQLKGMGSIGSQTESLLEESILGYEQE